MKKLFKSVKVLVWSPMAILISLVLALAFGGWIVLLPIVVVLLSAINSLRHILDKDVEILP